VEVRRREGAVEVETPRLRLRVELGELRFELARSDGRVRLARCYPRLRSAGRSVPAGRAELESAGPVDTPIGPATRLRLRAATDAAVELELELDVSEHEPGVVARLIARNAGDAPLAVESLELECTGIELPGDPSSLRFYRMGYQSWSPAARLPLRGRDARPRPGVLGRMHFGPYTPRARRGQHVSDFATTVGAEGEQRLTLGFLSHHVSLTHVAARHARGRVETLVAASTGEGVPVAAGETYAGERLWLGLDDAYSDGLAVWAERAGREMQAPVPAPVGSGWCSWYHYFTGVRSSDIEENVRRLGDYRGVLDVVQIDDGFQARVGDWLEPDADFPGGVAPLAAVIRDAGFGAGLWLAPFLASRSSKLAANHPEWLLRDGRGRPVFALVHTQWHGRWIHALDPTHPEVISWLGDLVRSVRRMGFDYLKLDFLYAGALAGARHDPGARSAEAYRRGLASLRDALGDDGFLVGCGAPLGPSIGLVDAMRIGPDVAPHWGGGWVDRVLGVRAGPSARNSIHNVLARSALHQRLWQNDPDCVLLRDDDTRLSAREVESVAGAVAISGGLVVASDDMARVGPERAELLARLLPPLGDAPQASAPSEGGEGEVPDELWQRLPDAAVLLYRVNLGARPLGRGVDPAHYGLDGPVRVYDVMGDADMGGRDGPFELEPLAPRQSMLLRLTPLDGRLRVVGSSLHVSGGSLGTASLEPAGEGRGRLELRLPGGRAGRVLLAFPGQTPVPVRVIFQDRLELEVLDQGVVQRPDMAD
jgi:alpha-galactosidase